MFKGLFSKEKAIVSDEKKPEAVMMDEKEPARDGGAASQPASQKKAKSGFRRLRDIYNQLPVGMSNRVREIDYSVGQTLVETHKILVLILNEIGSVNADNPLFGHASDEWDEWYGRLERASIGYRKTVRDMLGELVGKLRYKAEDVERLNRLIAAKPNEVEALTGLDRIEDLKSNLIDVAVLLGRESESRIVQHVTDEPVRNIIDSFEYNLEFFEKMMSATGLRIRKDIERCWQILSTGVEPVEAGASNSVMRVEEGGSNYNLLLHEIRQLRGTFKYFNAYKLTKGILGLDSTCHRLALSLDGRTAVVGGNGCKLRQRDLQNAESNTFTEKSRRC